MPKNLNKLLWNKEFLRITTGIRGSIENICLSNTVLVPLPLPLLLMGFNMPAVVVHGSIENICLSSSVRLPVPSLPAYGLQ